MCQTRTWRMSLSQNGSFRARYAQPQHPAGETIESDWGAAFAGLRRLSDLARCLLACGECARVATSRRSASEVGGANCLEQGKEPSHSMSHVRLQIVVGLTSVLMWLCGCGAHVPAQPSTDGPAGESVSESPTGEITMNLTSNAFEHNAKIDTRYYFFKLYALDIELDLKAGATKKQLIQAMAGHILAESQLMGVYER